MTKIMVERVARAIAYAAGDDYYEDMRYWAKQAKAAIKAMRDSTEALTSPDTLRTAIAQHRANVWGTGPVGHPDDADLYRAAGMMDVVEREVDDAALAEPQR